MITKLKSPNPDMNGVSIHGYDRVPKNPDDGLFHVHDSNLAMKLQAPPWNFKVVVDPPAPKKAAQAQKLTEEKSLEEMSAPELKSWLTERGEVTEGLNKADLLKLAQARREADSQKSQKKE